MMYWFSFLIRVSIDQPEDLEVRERIFCLNRLMLFNAILTFGSLLAMKLNPRKVLFYEGATADFSRLTLSFSFFSRKLVTDSITLFPAFGVRT
jgi:hypothetical protein